MLSRFLKKYQISLFLGVVLSFFGAKHLIGLPKHLKFEMEVELLSPAGGVAALYCDDGRGYRSDRRIEFAYETQNEASPSVYRFTGRLPCGLATKKIRFDPAWAEGEVIIRSFSLRTYRWMPVDLGSTIGNSFKIINAVSEFELLDRGVRIKSSGVDPIVELTDDVESYFELRILDVAILIIVLSIIFSILLKALQAAVSAIFVRGPKIEAFRVVVEAKIDGIFDRVREYLVGSCNRKHSINISAYLLAFTISCYGSWLFLTSIYPAVTLSFISALVGAQATILLFLSFIFILAAMFRDSSGSWFFPGASIILAVAYVADAQLFRLNGMHLNHGLDILFEGGIQNFQKNLEFTKLDKSLLLIYEAVLLTVIVGAFLGAFLLGKISVGARKRFSIPYYFIILSFASLLVLSEQIFSTKFKPQTLWAMEQSDIPTYIKIYKAKDYIFEYPIKVGGYKYINNPTIDPAAGVEIEKKDVYLFILESVREDLLDKHVAPNLWKFRNSSVSFSKAMANGNATHYGWYSIVNSRVPLYWETYKNKASKGGSESLLALKRMGYSINIHSSKDLTYLGANETMFGSGQSLLNYITEYNPQNIPSMDVKVTDKLIAHAASETSKNSFNIIFWDSTHYPYRWPKESSSKYTPFAGSEDSGVPLNKARELAISQPHMLMNRYKNSIHFTDQLFGRFVDSLKATGRYDDSIIVVVGDHGQQFMEHNFMMHGRTLFSEDLHVPLYIHAPGYGARKLDRVASQIDIMPTIFGLIGAESIAISISDGQSLLGSDDSRSHGVAAAAGFKNTPFRYLAEVKDWKLLFDIDKNDPLSSKKLFVKKIYNSRDVEHIPGSGSKEDYRGFINANFGGVLDALPFITVTGEAQ